MKKVNLLSRAEMKKVMGGFAGTCAVTFDTGAGQGGTGTSYTSNGTTTITPEKRGTLDPAVWVIRGVSYAEAQSLVSNGGRWCCDSCDTASWY